MRKFPAATTLLGAILATAVVLGTTACTPSDSTQTTQSDSPGPASSTDAPVSEPADGADQDADSPQQSSVEQPDGLPDIGIPFYPSAQKVAGVLGADPLFMGEYVTSHELTIVNMFFRDKLKEYGWEFDDKSVQGSNTISKVRKPGYFLVVVVGPNRTVDTDTSIHYTLRAQ